MTMRALALASLLLAPALAHSAALDLVFFQGAPSSLPIGANVTVELQVKNNLSSTAMSVTPLIGVSGGSANWVLGPAPASQDIIAGATRSFSWVYASASCGVLQFSGQASGWDSGAGLTVTSLVAGSNVINVVCTPTPSPTITLTPTITPTPSISPTATDTPWVAYVTATPAPSLGEASIRGNLYHPDRGQPLELRFSVPYDGRVSISLVNRLGQRIRRIERDVQAGAYIERWDGRTDAGIMAAGGIYVALFQGKGLNKSVKFAVIR